MTIDDYYQNMLLSSASYADLTSGLTGESLSNGGN